MVYGLHKRPPRKPLLGPRALMWVVFACAIYILHSASGRGPALTYICENGPLQSYTSCMQEHSEAPDLASGWSYSYASGVLNPVACEKIQGKPNDIIIHLARENANITISKIDCSPYKLDSDHLCYASQYIRGSQTRILNILTSRNDCSDAHFFSGSKAKLADGKPQKITDWQTPYSGIPEIKAP